MLLRALREPDTRHPSPLARLLAVLVVVGLVGASAPVLYPVLGWLARIL